MYHKYISQIIICTKIYFCLHYYFICIIVNCQVVFGEIKIKAQKSGSVKLQAKQGKKKTIYNITVKKQAPKKSEIKQLTKFYKECFIKSSKQKKQRHRRCFSKFN